MIVVCPLSAVDQVVASYRPERLITLLNPDMMIETPSALSADQHLKLPMNDIDVPTDGLIAAKEDQVHSLITFVESWSRSGPLAIHCWAGISRSTAAAFVTLCHLNPAKDEEEIAQQLRIAAPFATPNRRIVDLADSVMGREGRMINAVEAIGRGADAWEGSVFEMPAGPRRDAAAIA